jgi:hypothetical protein
MASEEKWFPGRGGFRGEVVSGERWFLRREVVSEGRGGF